MIFGIPTDAFLQYVMLLIAGVVGWYVVLPSFRKSNPVEVNNPVRRERSVIIDRKQGVAGPVTRKELLSDGKARFTIATNRGEVQQSYQRHELKPLDVFQAIADENPAMWESIEGLHFRDGSDEIIADLREKYARAIQDKNIYESLAKQQGADINRRLNEEAAREKAIIEAGKPRRSEMMR